MSHDSRMRPSRMFVGVELSVEALRPGTSNFLTDLELGTTFSVPVARSSTWMEPIAEAVGLYFLVSLLHIPFVRSPSSSEVPGRSLASAEYFTFERSAMSDQSVTSLPRQPNSRARTVPVCKSPSGRSNDQKISTHQVVDNINSFKSNSNKNYESSKLKSGQLSSSSLQVAVPSIPAVLPCMRE